MNTISFRTGDATKQKLDFLASSQNRDRSFIINQALDYYLSINDWQIEHIQEGVKQANRGEFADEQTVKSVFTKWEK